MAADGDFGAVGKAAHIAVGITGGNDGNARGPFEAHGQPVADARPRGRVVHLQNGRAHAHHFTHRIGLTGPGIDPIQGAAGAYEIEMIIPAQKGAGRVGEAGRGVRQRCQRLAEILQLHQVEIGSRYFGTGEMAHPETHVQTVADIRILHQAQGIPGLEAETVEPGFELNRSRADAAVVPGPDFGIATVADDRNQVVGGEIGRRTQGKTVQDVDGGTALAHGPAQAGSFLGLGDHENATALAIKGFGDMHHAQPIGIGLDNGGKLRPAQHRSEEMIVAGQGAEIDIDHRAGNGMEGGGYAAPRHGRRSRALFIRRLRRVFGSPFKPDRALGVGRAVP